MHLHSVSWCDVDIKCFWCTDDKSRAGERPNHSRIAYVGLAHPETEEAEAEVVMNLGEGF